MAHLIFGHDPTVTVENLSGQTLGHALGHTLTVEPSISETSPAKKSRMSLGRNRNQLPSPENLSGNTLGHALGVTVENFSDNTLGHAQNTPGHAQVQAASLPKKSKLSLGRNRNKTSSPSPPVVIPECKSFFILTFQNLWFGQSSLY